MQSNALHMQLRRALKLLLASCLVLLSIHPVAQAHEMSMAEMEVRETSPGEYFWHWTAVSDRADVRESELVPHWPDRCQVSSSALHCGQVGLKGTLSVDGVGKTYSAAIVRITWLDGQMSVYTLTTAQPSVQLYGSAQDRRGMGEIARAYVVLGVEHILSGVDHLLFVAGLLFLVGFRRRLIGTITAFTVAHSLTLALSALGLLTLRPAPVEASIALSIVLVAGEALRQKETLAKRVPALVSFLFGLVHGLGFAGALQSVGLPQRHLPLALLCFNVGVEIGQLMMVFLAFGFMRLPVSQRYLGRARRPALYLVGAVAAYWSWLRIAALAF